MTQGKQPGAGALEHGDAGRAQFPGHGRVHGGGDVGQHRHRLACTSRDFGEGIRIGPVAVELGHQVHRERDRGDGRVAGQRGERLGELPLRLGARAPHVQRVARFQARVEHLGDPPRGGLADRPERHAQVGGQVGDVRPFQAGVVHRGDPAARARSRPPPDREQLQRVGQLRQVGDPVHAVGVRERLPRPVRAGQRPGMRGHQRAPGGGTSRRQQHHGNLPNGCRFQHLPQRSGIPHRLKDQGQHPGLRQVKRVPCVLGGRGDQLLAGGDGHGVPERPAGAQHRGEHRTGLGDQRDRARRKLVRLLVPDRPQPVAHVDEAHAASAAQGHPGGARRRGDPVPERDRGYGAGPGFPGARLARGHGVVRATEDHRGSVSPPRGQVHLPGQCRVGHPEQHQVHRPGQGGKRGMARHPADLPVLRVDQVHRWRGRAARHLGHHPLAERARPRAGADQGHAAGFEHRAQGRLLARPWRRPVQRCPGRMGRRHGPKFLSRHDRRGSLRRLAFLSAIAALAACMPGMPQTPPPACVAELA